MVRVAVASTARCHRSCDVARHYGRLDARPSRHRNPVSSQRFVSDPPAGSQTGARVCDGCDGALWPFCGRATSYPQRRFWRD